MHRSSFAPGQVSAAFVKALLLCLDAEHGPAQADKWLRRIHTLRDDLEDETRQVPLLALHDALVAFAETVSRDAIAGVWRYLIAPENLGSWMRVLRGTATIADAFGRLHSADSAYGRTQRWETIAHAEGVWHGRVHILHDPQLEADGLLGQARVAELLSVPALFGYVGARATAAGTTGDGVAELTQLYEVRWNSPRVGRAATVGAVSAALTTAVVAVSVPAPVLATLIGAVAAGVIGGTVATSLTRDRLRRIESTGQAARVRVLERSLALKEARERAAAGDLAGSVVAGQYRIGARMGSGASGVIYEALRVRDGLPVAIKLLRAAAAHDAIASDRLRREAEALGLAWHPNVVEMIDHGHLPDGTAFLVMELLRGEALGVRLRVRGRLPPRDVVPIAVQVCEALTAVHAAGIIHRDLKPSNIFVERRPGGGERIKLLDFGIARVEWAETRITSIGAPVGTPGYMAPEQEIGGEVDARSDLFAVGAVIYECLVGEPPPPTPSGLWLQGPEKGQAHRDKHVQAALRELPRPWQMLIERALAPIPRDRFQDARTLSQAVKDLDEASRPAKATS